MLLGRAQKAASCAHAPLRCGSSFPAQEEIFSSSFAAAAYFEATNFPKDKKVYVVGEVGIQEELDLVVRLTRTCEPEPVSPPRSREVPTLQPRGAGSEAHWRPSRRLEDC